MTQKEQVMINEILEAIGLEPIKIQSTKPQRRVHDEA